MEKHHEISLIPECKIASAGVHVVVKSEKHGCCFHEAVKSSETLVLLEVSEIE
jgi:hypothetical protein